MKEIYENWRLFTEAADPLSDAEIVKAFQKLDIVADIDLPSADAPEEVWGRYGRSGTPEAREELSRVARRFLDQGTPKIRILELAHRSGLRRWLLKDLATELGVPLEALQTRQFADDKVMPKSKRAKRRRRKGLSKKEMLRLPDIEDPFFDIPEAEREYLEVLHGAPGEAPDGWIRAGSPSHMTQDPGRFLETIRRDVADLSGGSNLFNPDEDYLYYNYKTKKIAIAKAHPEVRGIIVLPDNIRWDYNTGRWSGTVSIETLTDWVPEYIPKEHNPLWTGAVDTRINMPEVHEPRPGWGRGPELDHLDDPGSKRWTEVKERYVPKDYEVGDSYETEAQRNERLIRNEELGPEHARLAQDERARAELLAEQSLDDSRLRASLDKKEKKLFNKSFKKFVKKTKDVGQAESMALQAIRTRRKLIADLEKMPFLPKSMKTLISMGKRTLLILAIILTLSGVWIAIDWKSFMKYGPPGWIAFLLGAVWEAIVGIEWSTWVQSNGVKPPETLEEMKAMLDRELHPDQKAELRDIALAGIGTSLTVGLVDLADVTATIQVEEALKDFRFKWSLWNAQIGRENKKFMILDPKDYHRSEVIASPTAKDPRGFTTPDKTTELKLQCAEHQRFKIRTLPRVKDMVRLGIVPTPELIDLASKVGYRYEGSNADGSPAWRGIPPDSPGAKSCKELAKRGIPVPVPGKWMGPEDPIRSTPGPRPEDTRLHENIKHKVIKLKILKERKVAEHKVIKLKIIKERKKYKK